MNVTYTEKDLQRLIQAAIQAHGNHRDALIPILAEINRALGFIPTEAIGDLHRALSRGEEGVFISDSQIFAVASFYHMFSLQQVGRHVVRYCESAPCHVAGGRTLIQALQAELGLQPGQTSPDRRWTLLSTSCLGVCAVGPVILIDDDLYGALTVERLPHILGRYA